MSYLKTLKNIDYYLVGIFDGEGWFYIAQTPKTSLPNNGKRHTKREYRIQAYGNCVLKEKYIIELLVKKYHGKCTTIKSRNKKHATYYKWHITGPNLKKFAELVATIGLIKRDRAKIIRDLQEIKSLIGNKSVSDELYEKQLSLVDEMKALNLKGVDRFIKLTDETHLIET